MLIFLTPKKSQRIVVLSPPAVLFPPSILSISNLLFLLPPLVELRYHLELFEVAYKGNSDYIEVVDRIQTLQRLLGSLQDLQGLALALQKRHGSLKKMPALAKAIYKEYEEVSVKHSNILIF